MAGLPRRYSDYPDAYAGWNLISSFGSIVSLIGVFFFIYIIYRTLTDKVPAISWLTPEMFDSPKDAPSFNSLEWSHSNPPVAHTYNELPYLVTVTN